MSSKEARGVLLGDGAGVDESLDFGLASGLGIRVIIRRLLEGHGITRIQRT
jgi:hypothetical protein